MRIKVVSDGTPSGTSIVDIATGEPLRQVRSLTWSINATGDARCILELDHVPVEMEANVTVARPEVSTEVLRKVKDGIPLDIAVENETAPSPPEA